MNTEKTATEVAAEREAERAAMPRAGDVIEVQPPMGGAIRAIVTSRHGSEASFVALDPEGGTRFVLPDGFNGFRPAPIVYGARVRGTPEAGFLGCARVTGTTPHPERPPATVVSELPERSRTVPNNSLRVVAEVYEIALVSELPERRWTVPNTFLRVVAEEHEIAHAARCLRGYDRPGIAMRKGDWVVIKGARIGVEHEMEPCLGRIGVVEAIDQSRYPFRVVFNDSPNPAGAWYPATSVRRLAPGEAADAAKPTRDDVGSGYRLLTDEERRAFANGTADTSVEVWSAGRWFRGCPDQPLVRGRTYRVPKKYKVGDMVTVLRVRTRDLKKNVIAAYPRACRVVSLEDPDFDYVVSLRPEVAETRPSWVIGVLELDMLPRAVEPAKPERKFHKGEVVGVVGPGATIGKEHAFVGAIGRIDTVDFEDTQFPYLVEFPDASAGSTFCWFPETSLVVPVAAARKFRLGDAVRVIRGGAWSAFVGPMAGAEGVVERIDFNDPVLPFFVAFRAAAVTPGGCAWLSGDALEPAKPEPAKPEPAKPEPAKPEPAKPEPAKPEPIEPIEPAPRFRIGDRIRVLLPGSEAHGRPGIVAGYVTGSGYRGYRVHLARWSRSSFLATTVSESNIERWTAAGDTMLHSAVQCAGDLRAAQMVPAPAHGRRRWLKLAEALAARHPTPLRVWRFPSDPKRTTAVYVVPADDYPAIPPWAKFDIGDRVECVTRDSINNGTVTDISPWWAFKNVSRRDPACFEVTWPNGTKGRSTGGALRRDISAGSSGPVIEAPCRVTAPGFNPGQVTESQLGDGFRLIQHIERVGLGSSPVYVRAGVPAYFWSDSELRWRGPFLDGSLFCSGEFNGTVRVPKSTPLGEVLERPDRAQLMTTPRQVRIGDEVIREDGMRGFVDAVHRDAVLFASGCEACYGRAVVIPAKS